MALPSKKARDQHQTKSLAEDFRLSHEAKFQMPTLEERYWENPNEQKGTIARCLYEGAGIKAEAIYKEGV